jgi:hypothetical protein
MLFDTPQYTYRVFVTNMDRPLDALVWFLQPAGGAETLWVYQAQVRAGLMQKRRKARNHLRRRARQL